MLRGQMSVFVSSLRAVRSDLIDIGDRTGRRVSPRDVRTNPRAPRIPYFTLSPRMSVGQSGGRLAR